MDNWDSDLCNEHMKKMLQIKITAAGLALRALSALYSCGLLTASQGVPDHPGVPPILCFTVTSHKAVLTEQLRTQIKPVWLAV